jgi:hypothetical protein
MNLSYHDLMDEVRNPLNPSTRTELFATKDLLSNPFTNATLTIRIGRENPISLYRLGSRAMKSSMAFEIPGLADSTAGGGCFIQTFVFPTCKYIWLPIDSSFNLQRSSGIK